MRQICFVKFLAVKFHALHIAVLVAHLRSLHLKRLAVAECQLRVRQIGRAEHILVCAGAHRIETQCCKHIPCRHLAAVIIAAEAVDIVAVHPVHDLAHPVLRLPRLTRPCVEIRYMVTRLIAMHIAPDQPLLRHILSVLVVHLRKFHDEKRVKILHKLLLATHLLHQSVHIMRHKE